MDEKTFQLILTMGVLLLDYWLGKTKKTKSNSSVELLVEGLKRIRRKK